MKTIGTLLSILAGVALYAQGTLQFNQVIVLTSASGQVTVPGGKVWKVTSSGSGATVRYSNYSSDLNPTWTVTNPNPCTGATSGSSTARRVGKYACPTSNNGLVVDGIKVKLSGDAPLWFPANTVLKVTTTPCVNNLSPNMPSNTPYYVYDETSSPSTTYYECDGPINQGAIINSPIFTIIEFNIIP